MNTTVRISELCKTAFSAQLQSVRFRYHADKIAKGKLIRRFGFKETMLERGLLPHVDGGRLPMPVYRPKDMWNERRALFGQNDYIDILGNDSLHPSKILYDVPIWLRGFKGNEFQHLLRKREWMKQSNFRYNNPSIWYNIEKRIKFLYRYLNLKTRNDWTKQ